MDRCSICPAKRRPVPSWGKAPCRYLMLGEAPGWNENKEGVPFIGDAGQELFETYGALAGLTRPQTHISNTVLCQPDNNRTPNDRELFGCAGHHLCSTLERVQPKIVFLLGGTPAKLVPEIQLDVHHGRPQKASWHPSLEIPAHLTPEWFVPMFHPAGGMHNPALMIPQLEDWETIRPWLRSRGREWPWPVEEEGSAQAQARDFRLARTKSEVLRYFKDYPPQTYHDLLLLGGDTESHEGEDYSIQVSTCLDPPTAVMVLLSDVQAIKVLGSQIREAVAQGGEFALHNAGADIDLFEAIAGCQVPYRDTMQEVWHWGRFYRQGLKNVAYRLFALRMKSWEDVVDGPSKAKLFDWIEGLEFPEIVEERISEKTGKRLKPKIKRTETERRVMGIYRSMLSNPDYNPWKREQRGQAARLQDDDFDWGEGELAVEHGGLPGRGIRWVKLEEQVAYGCLDAAVALRLAVEMERKRREEQVEVWEGDWDV